METPTRVTPFHVFPTPDALGEYVASRVLERVARAHGRSFFLGCPTGRTPRPIYDALARREADLSNVVLVMMDEYLVNGAYANGPWSCHEFVRRYIAFDVGSVWFPDPSDPGSYDARIADAGGIDLFILASGASDGHVAFNAPGSPRESRTRIVSLSETTRRDNLQTSPSFGSLENVPREGITVGIDTIAAAREAIMVLWGPGKRLTLQRIRAADQYDADWPATIIHDSAGGEIFCDSEAAGA